MTVTVRIRHIRAAGHCMRGARHWFARHDLSWQTLLAEGHPVETIEATGDAFALNVARIAREEQEAA